MALADSLVDRIHTRLLVRYGGGWLRMWDGIPPEAVKADWAETLDGLSASQVQRGLENLPHEWPPTAGAFRELCIDTRPQPYVRLNPPKADPGRVAAECEKLQHLKSTARPLDWARSLEEREKAGESLTMAQRQAWRAATKSKPGEGERLLAGEFKPIDPNCLPPAMRREMGLA